MRSEFGQMAGPVLKIFETVSESGKQRLHRLCCFRCTIVTISGVVSSA